MLHYADTYRSSTIVSVPRISSYDPSLLPTPSSFVSSSFSYAVGPIDPTCLTSLHTHLSTGDECCLLIPVQLPPALHTHPVFKEAYECAYLESYAGEEEWSIPKLLNTLYRELNDLQRYAKEPDVYPWTVGFMLGVLALIAEQDRTLALTGLAHYCFVLPLMTLARPSSWPRREPYNAFLFHQRAVKKYRVRVHTYQEQGKSFDEAQSLALQEK